MHSLRRNAEYGRPQGFPRTKESDTWIDYLEWAFVELHGDGTFSPGESVQENWRDFQCGAEDAFVHAWRTHADSGAMRPDDEEVAQQIISGWGYLKGGQGTRRRQDDVRVSRMAAGAASTGDTSAESRR